MTYWQMIALLVAAVAIVIIFLYPPYWIDAGLFGGTVYVYYRNPPDPGDQPSYNGWLLRWELAFVILSLVAALVVFRSKAQHRQRIAFGIGYSLEMLWLAYNMRQFDVILAPEFTWYSLNLVAGLILVLVLVLGRSGRTQQIA